MNWISELYSKKKDDKKIILKKDKNTPLKVTSEEYYKFWAIFLAKPTIDFESLFYSTIPERLRFAIYTKIFKDRQKWRTMVVDAEENDSEIVQYIFNTFKKNPNNLEHSIFKIYKNILKVLKKYQILNIEYKILIHLIFYFRDLEFSTDSNTMRILLNLLIKKGLASILLKLSLDQNDNQPYEDKIINKVWLLLQKEILDLNFTNLIKITDIVVTQVGVNYQCVFSRAVNDYKIDKPEEILGSVSLSANKNLFKIKNVKDEEISLKIEEDDTSLLTYKKYEDAYFDFLIIKGKLIEAQEQMKNNFNEDINRLKEENKKLSEENRKLKNRLEDK